MGWIEQHFQKLVSEAGVSPEEGRFESGEQGVWDQLVHGLEQDVREFQSRGGDASFRSSGEQGCRVTSAGSATTLVLTPDLQGHMIRYEYQPDGARTAVPEGGILTLRSGARGIEIYSADQRLSSEAARQLMLEAVFFPPTTAEGPDALPADR